jgi:hypothetical protein
MTRFARGFLGGVGAIVAVATLGLLLLLPLARFYGAGGDAYLRLYVLLPALILVGAFAALTALMERPWKAIVRWWPTWACAGVVALLVAWAYVGIDSVRPLRDLPESTLVVPGSAFRHEWSEPEIGGWDGPTPAHLGRSYSFAGSRGQVETFFLRELSDRGWIHYLRRLSGGEPPFDEWSRDGYLIQLSFDPGSELSGDYTLLFWGRP